jgi:hypothetical protein
MVYKVGVCSLNLKSRLDMNTVAAAAVSTILMIVAICSFQGLDGFYRKSGENNTLEVTRAIEKAAVQCYALEGKYPPSIGYLKKNYGIVIDEDKYYYDYQVYGANLKPEIVVVAK